MIHVIEETLRRDSYCGGLLAAIIDGLDNQLKYRNWGRLFL